MVKIRFLENKLNPNPHLLQVRRVMNEIAITFVRNFVNFCVIVWRLGGRAEAEYQRSPLGAESKPQTSQSSSQIPQHGILNVGTKGFPVV